ncbi:hypothetical protein [Pseudomonas violetae]|uniref:Uncharacterized protein n=1 Tax=Pseudomonas violetae TaxID=2915813 RepID=A0ABT0ETP8_9PSED|nr:hypothetical protein [Pseudomonas violetae]MCK1789109.1 hypothetical protein [Pseudomonas violetae]
MRFKRESEDAVPLLEQLVFGRVGFHSAHSFLTLPEVGAVLVGGASLKSADFLAICRAATAMPPHSTNPPKEQ